MTSLNSTGALGNVISRLAGLKNVRPRRVMQGGGILENMEDEDEDVSGTSNPMDGIAKLPSVAANIPEPDLGGELTSQSYDVRANSASPPEQEPGLLSRFGSAISDYVNPAKRQQVSQENRAQFDRNQVTPQTPPVATAQADLQQGIPPVTASEEESNPQNQGFWKNLINADKNAANNIEQGTKNFLNEAFVPSVSPETYEQFNIKPPPDVLQRDQQRKQLDQKKMDEAEMNPMQVAAYGATDAFANQPELIAQFDEYTGINFDEQKKEMTEKYEKVLSDLQNGQMQNDAAYDEQERRIKERILSNEANDSDKFYIGMALLMPLLIGGIFGKEAALGALGGGAKGIADVYNNRQTNTRKDEELLSDIYKQRDMNDAKKGELDLERLKIPQTIEKNLPKDEYADLKGMNIVTLKDPTTGDVVASGPEVLPDLVLDLSYGNTPKKRERAEKAAEELEKEKAALERANQATSDIIQAAMQLKDIGVVSKILAYALSEEKNDSLKKLVKSIAPDIVVDGRKQNSAVYIDSKIEQMKDAYRRNEQMKAFTATVADHISNMAENPQYSGLKPTDLIDQMLGMRDRGQQFFVDRVASQGFYKQPLVNKFGKLNRELYKGLNSKEDKKLDERDKQLMYGSP